MALITYPLNNIEYQAEDAELFHCTRTSGIWVEDSFPITVTGADNNVTIGTGIAWINNEEFSGKVAAMKASESLDLGIADSVYPRIDVVAIQFSANANSTSIVVKQGTPSSNPVRPAIVRTGSIYELFLCEVLRPAGATTISAANVTDLRLDSSVCGLMADSVTKIDTGAIEEQVRELISRLQAEIEGLKEMSSIMLKSEWTDGDVIPVLKGGTGAATAEDARANLGALAPGDVVDNLLSISAVLPLSANQGRALKALVDAFGHMGVACSARGNSGAQTYTTGVVTNATLSTWIARNDTNFTFSDGGIKCPYAGTILVSGSIYIAQSAMNDGGCYIKKGSTEISSMYNYATRGGTPAATAIINVAAGDVIYLAGRGASSGSFATNNSGTHLDIMYIR